MPEAQITVLVHGSPNSIEAVRAQGLTANAEPWNVQILYRTSSRTQTLTEWKSSLQSSPPDILYVVNTAMPGASLAPSWHRRTGRPYILDTGDAVYAMAARSGIGAGALGWRLPLLWWFERQAQRAAATVVVRGTRHREHLLATGHPNVEVIRDGCIPPAPVDTETLAQLRKKLGLHQDFVVGLMGSTVLSPKLKICYGWDLLAALAELQDLPIRGLIIGDGPGLPWLRQRAQDLGVANRVVFTGRVPYPEIPAYLRLMDVALSTQTNNLPGQVRTTGKLPEYMAAGCFILASKVGDAEILLPREMLLEFNGEVDTAYPSRLASRLRELHADPSQLNLRHSLPDAAIRHCDYPILQKKWQAVIRRVL